MFLSLKEGEGKRMKDKTDGFSARERECVKDIGQNKFWSTYNVLILW